ncbi:hypothetical protein BpHYR1_040583 [Brachionus plicatilis]|uniref:C2H2-type domain-containing protein n=1 Tax=Brachionus plicatilis TaxID=10195 RepID=A0A3M7T127_BRAPC|nr:hypothetical protein BpHYR1_040583 [Brachionus plicatilis]
MNEIKKNKKKLQLTIINYKFKNHKRKGSFYKEMALVPVESSNSVECSICGEFMINEKGVKLHMSKKHKE